MSGQIATTDAPQPFGPYSQGRELGGLVQVSGQIGFDRAASEFATDVRGQTKQALANVKAVLLAANLDLSNLLMVRAFLADPSDFAEFNSAYAELVPEPFPARTTIFGGLPEGILVEIDALAVRTDV
ncbi:RidA family protein [Nocardia asteroides]|uniref:RidA family protein n=1 Tax=Nocardia asteroides TaxID=1824 RepID=UPI0037CC03F3